MDINIEDMMPITYCVRAVDIGLSAKVPKIVFDQVLCVDIKTGVWPAHLAEGLLGALDAYLLNSGIPDDTLVYKLISDVTEVLHHALMKGYVIDILPVGVTHAN